LRDRNSMGRPPKNAIAIGANHNAKLDLSILTQKPPSNLPHELDQSHRKQFLERSLSKSDREVATLHKLNRTIVNVKSVIKERYGESPLLDIGEGLIFLAPHDSTQIVFRPESNFGKVKQKRIESRKKMKGVPLDKKSMVGSDFEDYYENFHALARDFLLRMKLRNKLMNRLARRLMRLSHAMDGRVNKVTPPIPPKYGDARIPLHKIVGTKKSALAKDLNSDDTDWSLKRQEFEKGWKEREKAQTRIKEKTKKVTETNKHNIDGEKEKINAGDEDLCKDSKIGEGESENVKMEEVKSQDSIMKDSPSKNVKMEEVKSQDSIMKDSPSKNVKVESNVDTQTKSSDLNSNDLTVVKKDDLKPSGTVQFGCTVQPNEIKKEGLNDKDVLSKIDPLLFDTDHQSNFQKVATYDHDYDKTSALSDQNPNFFVGEVKLTSVLTQEELSSLDKNEEDFQDHQYARIDASVRNMSAKEKVMEWKRWQTDALARIPDQPTFQELGMVNRVFYLKERRTCVEEKSISINEEEKNSMNEEEDGHKNEDADDENKGDEDNEEQEMDEEESMDCEDESKKDTEGDEEQEMDEEESMDCEDEGTKETGEVKEEGVEDEKMVDNDESKDSKSDESEKLTKGETTHHKRKHFSLEPVPSFYHQDYQRTLHIHADILNCAMHESARALLTNATNEYNMAFRKSTEIQNEKMRLEAERNKATYQYRVQYNKAVKDHTLKLKIAKAQWQRRKEEFDAEKRQRRQKELQMMYREKIHPDVVTALNIKDEDVARRSLMGIVDRVVIQNSPQKYAIGTSYLSSEACRNRPDGTLSIVATTLAHCVDAVVKRVERGWVSDTHLDMCLNVAEFPKFQPPVSTTETIIVNDRNETLKQMEARTQTELQNIVKRLTKSENERMKAWAKLMKTKTEFDQPPPSRNARGNAGVDMSKVPAPPLKSTRQGKHKYNMLAPGAIPSKKQHAALMQSKYSIDKVNARRFSDGSVMPVSAPKKKDGLYMRPAGRQRKGMDWDAMVGKWVPAGKATKNS